MKQFIVILLLCISTNSFSQSNGDSIIITPSIKSIIIQKVDSSQIARINDIEERLSAFYTYNRRSHSLIYAGIGVSLLGVFLSYGETNPSSAIALPLVGTALSLVGTVIYLDSYKFLNFKPKRKALKSMTYY